MMSVAALLEDFSADIGGPLVKVNEVLLEEQRLEAFEKGYQAGWDDSAKSASEGSQRVAADLEQNLRDLAFTYQEAYSAILNALRPAVFQVVETMMPALAQNALVPRVTELIQSEVAARGRLPVELVTSPANRDALESLTHDANLDLPVTLKIDDALTDGQVFLRFGTQLEHEIDADMLQQRILDALSAVFQNPATSEEEIA